MMKSDLTYIFEEGVGYAIHQGKVIASDEDPEALERKVAENFEEVEEPDPASATHVVTPNGLKGKILGRVDGLWSDQVTVRFENGRIAHLDVSQVQYTTEKTAATPTGTEDLQARLAQTAELDRDGIEARIRELTQLTREAGMMIAKAPYAEQIKLDNIIVTAEAEVNDLKSALDYFDTQRAEAYEPPAPYAMKAGDGYGEGSWLDGVAQQAQVDAESTNYETLMDEGPEMFVTDIETAPLADAGVVRQMASRFIQSKTAHAEDEALVKQYTEVFLSRVEEARKAELATRKTETHKKTAAVEAEIADLPDDFLW